MREKYHTEGIVLATSELKESNRLYYILTERFGFIIASAQGVRFQKSKLRYGLQDYSLSDISVVRTGDIWKITNSVPKRNFYFDLAGEKEKSDVLARIGFFMRRFLHGEEYDPGLYFDFRDALAQLLVSKDETLIEAGVTLRSLNRLGMLKDAHKFAEVIEVENLGDCLEKLRSRYKEALISINDSLKESQL